MDKKMKKGWVLKGTGKPSNESLEDQCVSVLGKLLGISALTETPKRQYSVANV